MPRLKYNLDEITSYAVEPGRYRARLTKVEQTLSSQKKPMLVWYWKIVSGDAKGSEIRSFTSLLENALGNLKEHLEAMNYRGKVNVDTAKLAGKYATLVVGTRMGVDKAGLEREYSNVAGVLPDKKSKRAEVEEDEDEEEFLDDEDLEEEDEDFEEEDDEDEDEDEDDEDYEDEDDDDDDEEDDEDYEDEEDEEEDEEEEEPEPRRRKSSKTKSSASKTKKAKRKAPSRAEQRRSAKSKSSSKSRRSKELPF